MIIGTFTYDSAADSYRGQIQTLSLACAAVELRPQERSGERCPDYLVVVASPQGDLELAVARPTGSATTCRCCWTIPRSTAR